MNFGQIEVTELNFSTIWLIMTQIRGSLPPLVLRTMMTKLFIIDISLSIESFSLAYKQVAESQHFLLCPQKVLPLESAPVSLLLLRVGLCKGLVWSFHLHSHFSFSHKSSQITSRLHDSMKIRLVKVHITSLFPNPMVSFHLILW